MRPGAENAQGAGGKAACDGAPGAARAVEAALAAARERSELGAFWALCERRAADTAAALERRRARGERLPLAGHTLAVKDCFEVAGMETTLGLPGPHALAERDAAAVRALERAGAVAIGKTAMDPLALSTHGSAPGHPPCLNPRDAALSPGGSSSGSAAAVAAGIVSLGLGSDLAGSVRIPAAYCGIVALKPAPGAISSAGCVAAAPSFHVPGVMARSLADCRAAYEALAGSPVPGAPPELTVAVGEDLLEEADQGVAASCEAALAALGAAGAPVSALRALRVEWRGQGFGRALAFELARDWGERVEREPERFPATVHESVAVGRRLSRAAYEEALGTVTRARTRVEELLAGAGASVLACPTVPAPVPAREAERVEESIRHTRLFNALGWPALSLPVAPDAEGRPVGLQLAAPPERLAELLAVGAALERTTAEEPRRR